MATNGDGGGQRKMSALRNYLPGSRKNSRSHDGAPVPVRHKVLTAVLATGALVAVGSPSIANVGGDSATSDRAVALAVQHKPLGAGNPGGPAPIELRDVQAPDRFAPEAGKVDTRQAMAKPQDAPNKAARDRARAERIVDAARAELGTTETGDNCQKYSEQCVAWCALFAMSTWEKAGVDVNPDEYAFTGDVYTSGQSKGTAYGSDQLHEVRPGDVLLFGSGPASPSSSKHIGVVEHVDGDTVTLIEGNSGDGADEVVRKDHKLSADTFYGGVHPW